MIPPSSEPPEGRETAQTRRLTLTYSVTLATIAAVAIGGFLYLLSGLRGMEDDAALVNAMGRQRMLSQRVTKSAALLVERPEISTTRRTELETALTEWTEAAQEITLALGDSPRASETFAATLAPRLAVHGAAEDVLQELSRDAPDARQLSASLDRILESEPLFLEAMEAAVAAMSNESRSRVTRVATSSSIILVLLLATTALLGFAVLRPAVRRVIDSQEELGEALVAAEAASRTKAEFLANMSHELRTPMNGVLGMTQLLEDTRLDDEQRDYLHVVRASASSLLTVINDILDISKLEAGKVHMEEIAFDLHTTVTEVADLLVTQADEKGIELALRFEPDAPRFVLGDPSRVRQVLTNLVGNAIKFTEEGHVLIEVLGRLKDGRAAVELLVHDTGIGIDADKIGSIFESFTQADGSTQRRFGGTGLGLSISKSLAEQMNGSLAVSSAVGEGSVFTFGLDLPADPNALAHGEERPERLPGKHVLVVDDIQVNRVIFRETLRRWGMEVEEAADAAAGLQMLRDRALAGRPFDVALIDYMMPAMDGIALGQLIARDPDLRTTRRLLATSAAGRGEAAKAQDAGFDAYLVKPVSPDALRSALEDVLGKTLEPDSPLPTIDPDASSDKVLLVEDNPESRLVARAMLRRLGIDCDFAEDGVRAVELALRTNYQLIFMDCMMPVMDGLEATARIREREGDRRVPIVALTAHVLDADRELCLQAGMDEHLSKPYSLDDLKTVLETWGVRRSEQPSPKT
ncbi:MAG: response regulator [Acidobacteriota bacterium]